MTWSLQVSNIYQVCMMQVSARHGEAGALMKAQIEVSGSDRLAESAALLEFLRGDRNLVGWVDVVRRSPADGELGGAFDMLAVALGSGGVAAALAKALPVWVQTRRADVKVTVTSSSGKVELDARRVSDSGVLTLLESILRWPQ
jgi:hypothetical protein